MAPAITTRGTGAYRLTFCLHPVRENPLVDNQQRRVPRSAPTPRSSAIDGCAQGGTMANEYSIGIEEEFVLPDPARTRTGAA